MMVGAMSQRRRAALQAQLGLGHSVSGHSHSSNGMLAGMAPGGDADGDGDLELDLLPSMGHVQRGGTALWDGDSAQLAFEVSITPGQPLIFPSSSSGNISHLAFVLLEFVCTNE